MNACNVLPTVRLAQEFFRQIVHFVVLMLKKKKEHLDVSQTVSRDIT